MNDIHPTSVLFHIRFGCAQKLFCDMNEIYLVSVPFQIYFGCAEKLLCDMNDIQLASVPFQIYFGCAQKLLCDMNDIQLASVPFQIYFGCALARYYIAFNLLGLCCVTGMSYIFKKSVLDQLNGLGWYGRYLAEDFFLTKAMHEK